MDRSRPTSVRCRRCPQNPCVVPSGVNATALTPSYGRPQRLTDPLRAARVLDRPQDDLAIAAGREQRLAASGERKRVDRVGTAINATPTGRFISVRSQRITLLSPLAVASVLPSGENASANTDSTWPMSGLPIIRGCTGSAMSQSSTVLSQLAVASVLQVEAKPHREDGVGVPGDGWPGQPWLTRVCHVPQQHGLVPAGCGQQAPMGENTAHRTHRVGMLRERLSAALR